MKRILLAVLIAVALAGAAWGKVVAKGGKTVVKGSKIVVRGEK